MVRSESIDIVSDPKRHGDRPRPHRGTARDNAATAGAPNGRPCERLIFDVTDVVDYFSRARTVTGIQRVITQISLPLLRAGAGVLTFDDIRGVWLRVDSDLLIRLYDLAGRASSTDDPVWQAAISRLREVLATDSPAIVARGSILVSLGANWSSDRMFSAIRELQVSAGLIYACFVHDTVPIQLPEHCEPALVPEFRRWFARCMSNADIVITSSRINAQHIARACDRFQLAYRGSIFCPLGGKIERSNPHAKPVLGPDVAGASSTPFVLFVGTIEPRKDHLFVLACWRALAECFGIAEIPRLVVVGKLGWRYEPVLAIIDDGALNDRVTLLTEVSDDELTCLYDQCLFTIYNSHYEGWGLPVTESISRGKVPLIPRHSGLIESGGDCAVYFDPGSISDFVGKASRLIHDAPFRRDCTENVLTSRTLRAWSDIASRLADDLLTSAARRAPGGRVRLQTGTIYRLSTDIKTQSVRHYAVAEAVRGAGWHKLEDWGAWTSAEAFSIAGLLDDGIAGDAAPRGDEDMVIAHLLIRRQFKPCRLAFFAGDRQCEDVHTIGIGRTAVQIAIPADRTAGFKLTVRQTDMISLPELTSGGDARTIGVGVEAIMICRASDAALHREPFQTILSVNGAAR